MKYKVKKVPTMGEYIPLYSVAESMASSDANYSGTFLPLIFGVRREGYVDLLMSEAHAGKLEVCNSYGKFGKVEEIVVESRLTPFVTGDGDDMEILVLYTTLVALQEWGAQPRNHHTFEYHEHDSEMWMLDNLEGGPIPILGGDPEQDLSTRVENITITYSPVSPAGTAPLISNSQKTLQFRLRSQDGARADAKSLPGVVKVDRDATFAALFDPVSAASLEKMFPSNKKWGKWAERSARNGLKNARQGRALFNPYRAALWFLLKKEPNWDLARCLRTLASNLPARSHHEAHILTSQID